MPVYFILIHGALFLLLLMISYKDIKDKCISNSYVVALIFLRFLDYGLQKNLVLAQELMLSGLITSCILMVLMMGLKQIFHIIHKTHIMGMGDVKLFMACGFWLHIFQIPFFMTLTGIIGIIFGTLWFHIKKEREFPFGPCISLGLLTTLLLE